MRMEDSLVTDSLASVQSRGHHVSLIEPESCIRLLFMVALITGFDDGEMT